MAAASVSATLRYRDSHYRHCPTLHMPNRSTRSGHATTG